MEEWKLNLLNALYRLKPNHWIKNVPRSKHLDYLALEIMEKGIVPDSITPFEANFGNTHIWITNYPYAFGSLRHDKCYIMGSYVATKFKKYIDDIPSSEEQKAFGEIRNKQKE